MARAEQECLAAPLLEPTATARQRVPFVEVRLYRRGADPVAIFQPDLSGPGRCLLEMLEVAAGCDVVDSVAGFARRRQVGVCVLSGAGSVANVCIRQPGGGPGTVVTLAGRFDILSLSSSFLPPPQGSPSTSPAGRARWWAARSPARSSPPAPS